LCAWQPQLEYPFLPLTQNPLRHREDLPYCGVVTESSEYVATPYCCVFID